MIFLVSDKIDVSKMEGIEKLSVMESIDIIKKWPVVQFDSETNGIDPHVCHLTSMQFGYKHFDTGEHIEIVVDCNSVKPEKFKEVIENSYLIGHNLKFDLKFLYNHGIHPLNVYDTMICEQTLYLGYKPGRVSFKLSDVLYRHTGIELDKSYQAEIAEKGLTERGIRYAANDVVFLQDILKSQMLVAHSRNCVNAFTVENRFVPAIAYLEWCGVHLDEKKWRDKMQKDEAKLNDYLAKLNQYVVSHTKLNTKFVSTFTQPSLFDDNVDSFVPSCAVDWNSPKQVVPVFQELGFNTKKKNKKTKKESDSVEEKVLSPQKGIDDEFLALYLDYKGAAKTVSSYGQGHLNLINPNTGRLHTEFKQIGTVTGRMSSGGGEGESSKGKMNKDLARLKGLNPEEVCYVNLQNLPARGEEGKICRACFTATEGNVFISCDYSAEESRVQADVWNEAKLLDAFEHGVDTHSLYAKMCYPEELKDIDVKDVKALRPDLRQNAKYFEFELGYGGNGSETAKKLGLDMEKTMENVANVQREMPGMMSYKKKTGKFLKKNGYIIINPITGHRVYWPEWAEWKAVDDTFDQRFWEEYMAIHQGTGDEVCEKVRNHKAKSQDWLNKNVLNYPIQGGSAIVLKQAAADLFKWVVDNGYFGKILFCVFVHDEMDIECPAEISDIVAKKMQSIMEKAAAKYYKKLPIPAEATCGKFWIH